MRPDARPADGGSEVGRDADVPPTPSRETRHRTGFIDLHQDMLSGVAKLDGGFPVYGSSMRRDTCTPSA